MTPGKNFRLPRHVLPQAYRASLTLDLEQASFVGEQQIELTVAETVSVIHLHAVGLEISRAAFAVAGGAAEEASVTADAESETVTLAFASPLPAGAATLSVTWRGRFSPGLRGLYRAGVVAVTQFEAADARRVFPCFDEPAFKATWSLALRGIPVGAAALSNGAIIEDIADAEGKRQVRFATTPLLSSYLVAFAVGELKSSPERISRGVPIRTWSVPSKQGLTAFAQDCASAVLAGLEDYFGLPYPFGKLDQLGIPDFEAGAMENAGCITFREVALLLDPATAPLSVQKRVAEVITHELAHQWFGNLVTMVWWDDLWLNEAFATWMAFKIVDQWRPDWRIWMDFEVGKGSALALDAMRSAHPIRAEIRNAEEASESFDAITYEKGGAVLRMIEGYLGEARFRDGIRLYMQRHQGKNATADDLWAALGEASAEPIVELANGWIRQTGYPVVSVDRTDSPGASGDGGLRLQLSQRRFFSDADAQEESTPTRWVVPMVFRYRDADGVKEERVLLREPSAEIVLPARGAVAWCVANAEAAGFYRCRYDAGLLASLGDAAAEIAPAARMALVSDQWALVRSGAVDVDAFLDLIAHLASDSDPHVLDEIVGRLGLLEYRHTNDPSRLALQAFVARLFGPSARELGWGRSDDADELRLRRAALLRAVVGLARDEAFVAESTRQFQSHLAAATSGQPSPVDPNLLDTIITAAARTADAHRFDDFAHRAATEIDPAAKRRYLHALARVETPALVARAIELAMTDAVPMQDFTSYLSVLLSNRATREGTWALVRDRWTAVRAKADSPMLLRRLVESFGNLVEGRHLAEVKQFLADHPMDAVRQATSQTLERMHTDVALRERLLPRVAAWLDRMQGSPRA